MIDSGEKDYNPIDFFPTNDGFVVLPPRPPLDAPSWLHLHQMMIQDMPDYGVMEYDIDTEVGNETVYEDWVDPEHAYVKLMRYSRMEIMYYVYLEGIATRMHRQHYEYLIMTRNRFAANQRRGLSTQTVQQITKGSPDESSI